MALWPFFRQTPLANLGLADKSHTQTVDYPQGQIARRGMVGPERSMRPAWSDVKNRCTGGGRTWEVDAPGGGRTREVDAPGVIGHTKSMHWFSTSALTLEIEIE